MRTTVLDVIRLAWVLFRSHRQRRHLRIGQMVGNVATNAYYVENDKLLDALERARKGL